MLQQLSKRLSASLGSFPGLARGGIAAVAALALSSTASGQLFSNPAAINIPVPQATATPYPSTITVAGGPAVVSGDIVVTLTGISHTWPDDLRVILTAPSGQNVTLLNGNGGSTDISGVNLVFSPGSPPLPDPLVSGNFSPASGSLSTLAGASGNGVWSLYVSDTVAGADGGSIDAGWSIFFGAGATAASPNQFTYQGRLTGGPASGTIDTRFTLWESDTSASTAFRVAGPVTVSGLTLTNGLFSAPIDFGVPIPANRKTWLQIEVANPAGSAFVSLTPRQPMSYTPLVNVSSTAKGTHFGTTLAPGEAQNDPSRIGTQASFGTLAGCGPGDFNGMKVVANPGSICGVSEDILFFTAECNVACPREVMRINGDGNVGIGTSEPGARLDVVGAIAARSSTGSHAQGAHIEWNKTGGDGATWILNQKGLGGGGLIFGEVDTGNAVTENMRIYANGNVAIGNIVPTQKLHVQGNILATGTITPSCSKLKENVAPISDALDKLTSLDAVRFDWKADEAKVRGFTHDLGFIAEEVAKVFPEVVFRDTNGEVMGLDYSRMSAVAVGAIKQLKAENDQIKSDNADLKARLERIEAMLAAQAAK